MEREELFQAIEQSCHIEDSRTLLDRIRSVLEICEEPEAPEESEAPEEQEEPEESVCLERLREITESENDQNCNDQNYFSIEKSGKAIDAKIEKDECQYRWKIEKTTELKNFVEKYKGRKDRCDVVKIVSRLINEIKTKPPSSFDREEDNSEKLAKYVYETILKKYVKKISTTCYREIYEKGGQDGFYIELVDTINTYLRQLWVYTVIAQAGAPYNHVIDFYEPICESKSNILDPVIVRIECPAYIIEYIDEDEEQQHYCLPGTCILREGRNL